MLKLTVCEKKSIIDIDILGLRNVTYLVRRNE